VAGTCGYGEGLSDSINAGNFLTSCKVYWLVSQEGIFSREQVSKEVQTEGHKHTRLEIYNVFALPTVLYGLETWEIREPDKDSGLLSGNDICETNGVTHKSGLKN
jgi:hypothetical protein